MKHLRQYIKQLLLEGAGEPDLTHYVDELESIILKMVLSPKTVQYMQTQTEDSEVAVVLDTGSLFADYPNVNQVHMGLSVNDSSSASVDAMYACDTKDRTRSNLILAVDLPRQYDKIPELKDWISAELADSLSHELQHSCDTTEMLSGDCPEGEEKWESIENVGKYYGCEAEVRGHVSGIMGRARKTGEEPMDLLDFDISTIADKASDRGYTEAEIGPVLRHIYNKWLNRLEGLTL